MSVQEIDNPDLLTGPAREKIAKMSGRTIEDLNQLIFVYKQSLIVYLWLQEKYVRDVVSLLYSAFRISIEIDPTNSISYRLYSTLGVLSYIGD